MTHFTSSDDQAQLLQRSATIAVVGFSTNPAKPSHTAPMALVKQGFSVIPVHPTAREVGGLPAVKSLDEIDGHIDLVNVFRPSGETPPIVQAAIDVGADAVWLQLGIAHDESRAIAEAAGIDYVEGQCAGAMARRLDLHPDSADV